MNMFKNLFSRNNSNSENDETDETPRVGQTVIQNRMPEKEDEIMNIDPNTLEIDDDTLQSLVGIAVDILKQNIDNENQTMTSLVGIAVDILKQTVGPPPPKSIFYTMPEQDMRYSDLTFKVTDTDNGKKQPELVLSKITVKYDDAEDSIKITGYDIKNGDAGDGIYKKIIDELNLGEINLADLNDPTKKKQIIKNIVDRLKKEFNIDDEEYKKIEEYLEKLAEAVSNLKKNADELETTVNNI